MRKFTLSAEAIAKIAQWFANGDTGTSSETMALIAMGAKKSDKTRFDAPYDTADFGRCYRLVQSVPELQNHFGLIGRRVGTFKNILANWQELVELYERDLPKGRCEDLYRRIKELRGDCQNHPILRRAA